MDKKMRRKKSIIERGMLSEIPLIKTSSFFINEGCRVQKLYNNNHFAVKDLKFYRYLINEEKCTGMKVELGEEMEDGTAVICFDLDCKGNPEIGKKVLDKLLEEDRILKGTLIERTKSGGYHIFLRVPFAKIKDYYKVLFKNPFRQAQGFEKIEIEMFINCPITVAPTIAKFGKYELLTDLIILEYNQEMLHGLLKVLRDNSDDFEVVPVSTDGRGEKTVGVGFTESFEILDLNKIKYKIGSKLVTIFGNKDNSKNGDYILNDGHMLWNLKTHKRMKLKDFIIEQNGHYIERKIKW